MKQILIVVVGLFVLVALVQHAPSSDPPQSAAERAAQEAAHQRELKAAADKEAAEQRVRDIAGAKAAHLAFPVYVAAREKKSGAVWLCKKQVQDHSIYGATTDWFPHQGHDTEAAVQSDGNILVHGNEVRVKNGFGAEYYPSYTCIYNVARDSMSLDVAAPGAE